MPGFFLNKAKVKSEATTLVRDMNLINKFVNEFITKYSNTRSVDLELIDKIQNLYNHISYNLISNEDIIEDIMNQECQQDQNGDFILSIFGGGNIKLDRAWMQSKVYLDKINSETGQSLIKNPKL